MRNVELDALTHSNFNVQMPSTKTELSHLLDNKPSSLLGDKPLPPLLDGGDDLSRRWSTVEKTDAKVVVDWNWGAQDVVVGFNPGKDTIFIDWINSDDLVISENDGNTVFTVPSNGGRSVTLQDVPLWLLSHNNFNVQMPSTKAEVSNLLTGNHPWRFNPGDDNSSEEDGPTWPPVPDFENDMVPSLPEKGTENSIALMPPADGVTPPSGFNGCDLGASDNGTRLPVGGNKSVFDWVKEDMTNGVGLPVFPKLIEVNINLLVSSMAGQNTSSIGVTTNDNSSAYQQKVNELSVIPA